MPEGRNGNVHKALNIHTGHKHNNDTKNQTDQNSSLNKILWIKRLADHAQMRTLVQLAGGKDHDRMFSAIVPNPADKRMEPQSKASIRSKIECENLQHVLCLAEIRHKIT